MTDTLQKNQYLVPLDEDQIIEILQSLGVHRVMFQPGHASFAKKGELIELLSQVREHGVTIGEVVEFATKDSNINLSLTQTDIADLLFALQFTQDDILRNPDENKMERRRDEVTRGRLLDLIDLLQSLRQPEIPVSS